MSALRLARGVTGRDKVVKFDGCYHGHADALLAGGGSGVAMLGLPGSAGVTRAAVADTLVVPYNVVPELDDSVACVIVEPVAANMNLVAPAPGFLAGLRAECDRVGALLVFDEVITGFRLGPGGAGEHCGVTPDLWCFGKVIGGGLPVGAFGGRAELTEALAPTGTVYQAGTLSGNPLATAAGHAVLGHLSDADYRDLSARAARFAEALEAAIGSAGLGARASAVGPLVGLLVGPPGQAPSTPGDLDDVRAVAETGAYARLFHALADRRVALAPGPYEVLFPGLAHEQDHLDQAVAAAGDAAREVVARWS
jgi:glutamate-1-semialdehyde 2,1-aminomutase